MKPFLLLIPTLVALVAGGIGYFLVDFNGAEQFCNSWTRRQLQDQDLHESIQALHNDDSFVYLTAEAVRFFGENNVFHWRKLHGAKREDRHFATVKSGIRFLQKGTYHIEIEHIGSNRIYEYATDGGNWTSIATIRVTTPNDMDTILHASGVANLLEAKVGDILQRLRK